MACINDFDHKDEFTRITVAGLVRQLEPYPGGPTRIETTYCGKQLHPDFVSADGAPRPVQGKSLCPDCVKGWHRMLEEN